MGLFSRSSEPPPTAAGMALDATALRAATISIDDSFADVRQYAGGDPVPLSLIRDSDTTVSPGFDSVISELTFNKPAVSVEDTPAGTDVSIHDDFDEIVETLGGEMADKHEQWDGETVVAVSGRFLDAAATRLARRVAGPQVDPIGLVRADVASAVARGIEHADGASQPEPHPVVVVNIGLFNTTTTLVEVNVAEDRIRVQDRLTVGGGSQMVDTILAKRAVADALDIDEDEVPFKVWAQVISTVREVRDNLGSGSSGLAAVVEFSDGQIEVPVFAEAVQQEVTELVEQTTHNVGRMIDNSGYRLGEIGSICLTGLGVRTPGGDAYKNGIRRQFMEDLSGNWVTDRFRTGSQYAPERGAALIAQRELDDSTNAFDVYDD